MAEGVKKNVLPLLAMVIWLLASWGLDLAKTALKNFRSSTFIMTNLWVDLVIELVFAGLVILLVWLVLVKHKKSTLVGWVFIIIGLLALFQSHTVRLLIPRHFNIDVPPRYIRDDYSVFVQIYYSFIIGISSFLNSIPILGFFTKASALLTALGVANFFRKAD